MSLASFRQAVQDLYAAELDIPFSHALFDGPSEDRDVGCCFSVITRETDEDVNVTQLEVHVRVFKLYVNPDEIQQAEANAEALEALMLRVQEVIQPNQAGLGGTWFCRVVSVEIDHEAQGVEAVILGWENNPAVLA